MIDKIEIIMRISDIIGRNFGIFNKECDVFMV